MKTKLMTMILAAGAMLGAWARTYTAADFGKVVCADGSVYATAADASSAGKTALAMIACVNRNYVLAIALADTSATGLLWGEAVESAVTWTADKAVAGGQWRLPSADDFKRIFSACGGSEYTASLAEYMEFSWGDIQTMLSSAGGTQLDDYNTYWLSDEASEGTAWGYRTNLQLFRSYSKSNYWCLARPVLAFGAARTYNKVQLWENGPYWAETNIGADEPWDSGYYFWWGDTNGYTRVGDAWVANDDSVSAFSFSIENAQTYNKSPDDLLGEGVVTADYNLAPAYDAAQVQWGGGWRMPTYDDLQALCDSGNCDWTWVATNGVNGYIVSGKGDYASNSIFLPIVGYGDGTALENYGFDSCYWISGVYADNYSSRMFELWKDDFVPAAWNTRNRHLGFPIRPVQNAPAPANQWTSGDCTVTLDSEGTLTVSGPGAMADEDLPPWKEKSDDIKKIVIEDGVTAIGSQAFSDFREATSVQIGKDVVGIGGGAFYDCTSLSGELALPNGLTAIGNYAFCQCQNLSGELLLPNGLTTVEMYAFVGCKNFTTVKIPSTVTNIGAGVFAWCTGITDVYCHPNAADLTWGGATSDFKSDGSTKIHVKESQLAAYQEKFPAINATFVGDLPEFEFTTDGDVLWTLQGDGSWYSGRIPGSNGDNWLTTTVTGPGILSFDWKILGADVNSVYIECYVDDERVGENYGEGWQTFTHELGEGEHSVKLYYCEDGNPSLPGGAWMKNFRLIQNSVTPDVSITAGEYFKKTLVELGYDVPNDGATAYNVVAYGLPAGLKLKSNAAVTKKVKSGKTTKTVVVTPAKVEWWIEGVPTAALDYATNPPYLVITTNGVAQTLPLSLGVEAQDVKELPDLALGEQLNEQFYLPSVTNGWTVSGLPAGLKYTAKLVTTTKKKGKKIISVTTNALPFSVYGKTTKAGFFTITAKKKVGAYYETMKFKVLVNPAPVDTAIFGDELTNIVTMAYVPVAWDLTGGSRPLATESGGHAGRVTLPVVSNVVKVAGLPTGLTFAAKDTYKDKNKKQLKQLGQTIVGTPKKPGTYVVTFTKNVTTGTGKKKKTVAKTAQILWKVVANDAELSLGFNEKGAVIESGMVGLGYGDLMAFIATSNATVKASGLPKGITLVNLGDGQYAFKGFTAKAGTYLVTVTATLSGKTVTQRIALKVDGLPDWAKGTYHGLACTWNKWDERAGLATITVGTNGKISGKFSENGTNWTFSASSYDLYDDDDEIFRCTNIVAKYAYKVTETVKGKKKTVTKYLTRNMPLEVKWENRCGLAMLEDSNGYVFGYQNVWGQSGYKTLGKKLFYTSKKAQYKTWASVEADGLGEYDTLSMKVTPAGVVTATYKFFKGTFDKKGKPQYATYTCTTVLHPMTSAEVETDGFSAMMYLYFPPVASAGFKKYSEIVWYPFTSRKANVPDKAAIDAAKWCAGEYLGYGYAEFPGEDWLYGIFRVSVGADLAFTGTFEAIDGGVADFSGKLVKNVADGVAITVNGTPMSMGVKAMAKPYGKSKYGEIFAWSEAEEGQPNIHIDRAWQNIWTSVGMASARPKIAPGTTKTVDLAGAEIYRYPMGNYVEGDSFTYTFGEDGTVSVTGQVFGVQVDTTTAIAVETENGGTCDCILTFMINGRVFQQNFTMPSSGTVTSESISLDVSSRNFGIING